MDGNLNMNNEKVLISKDLIGRLIEQGEIGISEHEWVELREALDSKLILSEMYYIGDVDGYGCLYSEPQEDSLIVYTQIVEDF